MNKMLFAIGAFAAVFTVTTVFAAPTTAGAAEQQKNTAVNAQDSATQGAVTQDQGSMTGTVDAGNAQTAAPATDKGAGNQAQQ